MLVLWVGKSRNICRNLHVVWPCPRGFALFTGQLSSSRDPSAAGESAGHRDDELWRTASNYPLFALTLNSFGR
jgi:hypothetical protein